MNYIVLEIQKTADGTFGVIKDTYNNINDANKKYHTILSFAAVSSVAKHSACLLDENGVVIKSETYTH